MRVNKAIAKQNRNLRNAKSKVETENDNLKTTNATIQAENEKLEAEIARLHVENKKLDVEHKKLVDDSLRLTADCLDSYERYEDLKKKLKCRKGQENDDKNGNDSVEDGENQVRYHTFLTTSGVF